MNYVRFIREKPVIENYRKTVRGVEGDWERELI